MKTKMKLSLIALASLTTLAHAQAPVAPQPAASNPQPVQAVVSTPTIVTPVGQGNVMEREVTPLLREISRKKATLELKRLDREIEKLEEEALKAQAERDALANGTKASSVFGANNNFSMPGVIPGALPAPNLPANNLPLSDNSLNNTARVLMIYGFDNQLFAKIAAGAQGGYVVKKGDVMPDGRLVTDVKPNYVEVAKSSGKTKAGTERLFVSFSDASIGQSNNAAVGGQSTTNSSPSNLVNPIPAQPPSVLTMSPQPQQNGR